jgi:hypothetical protein
MVVTVEPTVSETTDRENSLLRRRFRDLRRILLADGKERPDARNDADPQQRDEGDEEDRGKLWHVPG